MSTAHPISSLNLQDPTLLKDAAYINGLWVGSSARFAVINPANGARLAEVANLDASHATAAIAAAQLAFPLWAAKTGKERAALMRRWFDLIIAHADDLAAIMTAEQGKPLAEARGEVMYGASFIEWFAEEAKRVSGDVMASTWSDKRMLVLKQPIGVCAAITPWNFPIAMITRKVAPALAAGCAIVIKPAEQTPLSALALAELAQRAGIPAGVINVLSADAEQSIALGQVLCDSPVVRHLSFTGSTPVGRILMRQSAATVKKLALELGGHAPFIVFEDADLDAAVEGALLSKFRNAGQTCVCTNRFYVHSSIYDAFVEKLAAGAAEIVLGDGFTAGVQQGPLIDAAAVFKVEQHVADALALGAKLVTGGKIAEFGPLFYQATVLSEVSAAMLIMQEETFGPVAAVMRFETEAEVIAAANATDFGLAAYFYSRDIGRIWRVAEQLEYGMVGINTGVISNEVAPFGGVKQSGLGREGSQYGIDEYLEMKYLCLGGIKV
ncbi:MULTISPECIES: NAD-dependent succinate-semialdehyde dehydrogenase [unclassified Undibacterium]|uniref:NAD-dependent succinate-semialdehyde dehydrogenase n=2 Tax=Bacteria TaxID=2 RepID=UPI002AC91C05|nr:MULTISPECIES: NAD-dependent succinate-semialdehyde dehydrogenase [unclassified Undibacterium]MEB0137929.1 NAD-dependent succinate-semialdehyde dehydrogenase [Undibacterium sp. CCC2.1]MEB0172049.1 NAD-dependent succinate-semialdehyde dehydrogenase [Undibacterium sp. CCC1.1]MEB0174937.1 NAD-dependent succinate-semialdehyde dehydrogenase [Undibacterium sp. CCC3.4]MEB0214855.1 NAD-dependent succinate-semialdehyde dehydrogenase [Undibacterium sp. 5I2]WPX45381.1 NAD-dependent succinate-semialdehy